MICESETDMEALWGGLIPDALLSEPGWCHDFDDVERCPADVIAKHLQLKVAITYIIHDTLAIERLSTQTINTNIGEFSDRIRLDGETVLSQLAFDLVHTLADVARLN